MSLLLKIYITTAKTFIFLLLTITAIIFLIPIFILELLSPNYDQDGDKNGS